MGERAHRLRQAFDRNQPREREQRETFDPEASAQRSAILFGWGCERDAHRLHRAAGQRGRAHRHGQLPYEPRARLFAHEPQRAAAAREPSGEARTGSAGQARERVQVGRVLHAQMRTPLAQLGRDQTAR